MGMSDGLGVVVYTHEGNLTYGGRKGSQALPDYPVEGLGTSRSNLGYSKRFGGVGRTRCLIILISF